MMGFIGRTGQRKDEGSLLLVTSMAFMVSAFVAAMFVGVMSGNMKSRYNRDFVFAGQAADAAVHDALIHANMQLAMPVAATPKTKTMQNRSSWTWHAVPTPNALIGSSYDIHASGAFGGSRRHVRATIQGIGASAASMLESGALSYAPTPGRGFIAAVLTDEELILRGGSQATSYDSSSGTQNTGHGAYASNNVLDLNVATGDQAVLYNFSEYPHSGRCLGNLCETRMSTQPAKVDMSSAAATKFMWDKINTCRRDSGSELVPWVASRAATPGVLTAPAGGACYESLVFDQNTTVTGSAVSPTVIYVQGDITVGPGVTVNVSSAAPSAPSLVIYSVGRRVAFDGSGASGPTIAAGLWAPLAECATNSALRPVNIYGSIACKRIGNGGAWKFHYDDVFAVNAALLGGPKIWSLSQIDGGKW